MIHLLHNPVRAYAWGSHTHIARLTAQDFGDLPAAEMWIGSHPIAPSRIGHPSGMALKDLIAADPVHALGSAAVRRFGERLPFLMKLLAASEPLSLQVHPTSDRAQRQFAAEQVAGIPLDARERSYPDPSHKPELLFALTRFEGLAGFRDPHKSAAILRGLRLPWLTQVADQLGGDDASTALKGIVTTWLGLPSEDVRHKLAEVRVAALSAESRAHSAPRMRQPPLLNPSDVERESIRVYAATVPLIDRYPSDAGVLVGLLLNHLVLAAGESIFIDSGVVHAYTSGFGVEIMAASDNVLRAGLTTKHVDIPGLLEVADFSPIPPPRFESSSTDAGIRLAPPVDDFELLVLDPHGGSSTLEREAPRLVLCLREMIELETREARVVLRQGQSAFVEAAGCPLRISGHGRAAVGQTPLRRD